jgi:transcriptional regulator with XRE-family HTH domain
MEETWDGRLGTAGGPAFGAALRALTEERGLTASALARSAGVDAERIGRIFAGEERAAIALLARLALALRAKPVEFLQRTAILSLETYALGLDPLYFLPPGEIRYDARIYMREINPRHPVPEGDMTGRNPTLAAVHGDALLDPAGKIELELTYLLRTAVLQAGDSP